MKSTPRLLFDNSIKMYGYEVKVYKRVWIRNPNFDKEVAAGKEPRASIPVEKIVAHHAIKRVYAIDNLGIGMEIMLHFIDGTTPLIISDEVYREHWRKQNKVIKDNNPRIINKQVFFDAHCMGR